jgi:hypothetical protein
VFTFETQSIRNVQQDGAIWFVAADVCAALDIIDAQEALDRLDEVERDTISFICDPCAKNGRSIMSIISAPGLYSLVTISESPQAETFKRWVTQEVVAAFRSHRSEAPTDEQIDSPTERLVGKPNYYQECRNELFAFIESRMPDAKWPDDEKKRQRIADGYLTDAFSSCRWLISFDHRGQFRIHPVNRNDSFVDCGDVENLSVMVRECIPAYLLPTVIELANERVLKVFRSRFPMPK